MRHYAVNINCTPEYTEVFIALLAELGYESFEEQEQGLMAYIEERLFDETQLIDLLAERNGLHSGYTHELIPEKNWNEEWERNFEPVVVNEQCRIRAPFHSADESYLYEVVIQPKMSFGTGHHSTTRLMMQRMLQFNFDGKKVLDFGSGTGVLAVLAAKLGAQLIDVVDNDEWAFDNSTENFHLNNVQPKIGTKTLSLAGIGHATYDVVLANINKNILLEYMKELAALMQTQSYLLLSGFFEHDVEEITTEARKAGLIFVDLSTENNWAVVTLTK